jgi:hypothetical protein
MLLSYTIKVGIKQQTEEKQFRIILLLNLLKERLVLKNHKEILCINYLNKTKVRSRGSNSSAG